MIGEYVGLIVFPTIRRGGLRDKRGDIRKGRDVTMKNFINMLRDESGASAAEYALILAIVGSAIAFAAVALGDSIAGSMEESKLCIDSPPTSATDPCGT